MSAPDHGEGAQYPPMTEERREEIAMEMDRRLLADIRASLIHLSTADLERAMVGSTETFAAICRDILRGRGIQA